MMQISEKPYFIAIAGPSGAGKSVFCRLMQSNFAGVSRLKLDDFFKDIDDVPKILDWTNWDDPTSIKWDELVKAATDLKSGHYAIVPHYSRKDDKMVGEKCVFSSPIILVDGFLSLYDPRLRDLIDLKIFFNLSEDSQVKRRKLRQPWVEDGYIENVLLPNARKHVIPTKDFADFIVNAELPPQSVADYCVGIISLALKNRIKKLGSRRRFETVSVSAKV